MKCEFLADGCTRDDLDYHGLTLKLCTRISKTGAQIQKIYVKEVDTPYLVETEFTLEEMGGCLTTREYTLPPKAEFYVTKETIGEYEDNLSFRFGVFAVNLEKSIKEHRFILEPVHDITVVTCMDEDGLEQMNQAYRKYLEVVRKHITQTGFVPL